MKCLGIIGSARKLGNTEILVREALAHQETSDLSLIRLTDLSIKPCRGCMACIFSNSPCPIDDDMNFLLQSLLEAERIVIGGPTYILGPAGIFKMATDRLFMASSHLRERFRGKRAATIGVAGVRNWAPYTLPLLNIMPLSLGYELMDSFTAHAPGPGEVLLDRETMERAMMLGKRLSGACRKEERTAACPVCFGNTFTFRNRGHVECCCCAMTGVIDEKDGIPLFIPDSPGQHRWTDEAMKAHIDGWIRLTEGRFKERLKEIIIKRKPYKDSMICWQKPGPK